MTENPLPKFCDSATAAQLTGGLGADFAVVRNPSYIHPPFELYPLAKPVRPPLERLRAVVCDMDGTTTTTEPLCLHSLEHMVRLAMGSPKDWGGLTGGDHPHIIGNSTTRHVEYLIDTYGNAFRPEPFAKSLAAACAWTLRFGQDALRRQEASTTAAHLGLGEVVDELAAVTLTDDPAAGARLLHESAGEKQFCIERMPERADVVRGAIEIYYARYHQILAQIDAGEGAHLGEELLGRPGARLIEPMPGVGLFLALLRGWLSPESTAACWETLTAGLDPVAHNPAALNRDAFLRAAARLHTQPAKVAIVTSSIAYEARIVLGELFSVLREQLREFPLRGDERRRVTEGFASPQAFYDAIVTASDSSEIRLKPHRDLYSIALHQLGLVPGQFHEVLGLEDSESGVIAIRAAGIGLCVALPFAQTAQHDLSAAVKINMGGLPQVMFEDGFFL